MARWFRTAGGLPIKLALTSGQAHDANGATMLLTDLANGGVVLGDKACSVSTNQANQYSCTTELAPN